MAPPALRYAVQGFAPLRIKSVVFSPQKGILASVGEDDSIVFWEVDFEGWSSRACRIANRNLTPKEWSIYFGNRAYRKTCPNLQ